MMSLSSRPCIQTVLAFLMLLQLAFKVSLQEKIAPKGGDPRTEKDIQELEFLKLKITELQTQLSDLKRTFIYYLKEFELLELKTNELQTRMNASEKAIMNIANDVPLPKPVILDSTGVIFKGKFFQGYMISEISDPSKAGYMETFRFGENQCNKSLALPRNAEENRAIQEIIKKNRSTHGLLGIRYNETEKKFLDMTNHSVHFFNWGKGQPENPDGKSVMLMNADGQWNVHSLNMAGTIICEIKI